MSGGREHQEPRSAPPERAQAEHDGFDALVRAARAHGLPVELRPPALAAPDTVASLGQPLDPGLGSLYVERTGGGRVWELFLYPATGEGEGLAEVNAASRMIEDDEPRLSQTVELAQLGYEATYLASLPEGAEAKGPQPVVYVDRNEGWIAVPIASTVDRMFGLLARYLERIIREYGEVATGRGSLLFPGTSRRWSRRIRSSVRWSPGVVSTVSWVLARCPRWRASSRGCDSESSTPV